MRAFFLFALLLLYPAPHAAAATSTCAELAQEAQGLFKNAKAKNPKEADHWKKEIDLADKGCTEGNEKQASGIFREVMGGNATGA